MDEPLSRIPFSRDEEHTIGSMARWMRFIAVVGIVGASLILLVLLVAAGVYSGAQSLTESSPAWAKVQAFIETTGPLIYLVAAAFLLATAVSFWQNFTLYHAGDDFNMVARTDTADLDYLSRGLDRLRVFFEIQVMVVFATIAIAVGTALVILAMLGHP